MGIVLRSVPKKMWASKIEGSGSVTDSKVLHGKAFLSNGKCKSVLLLLSILVSVPKDLGRRRVWSGVRPEPGHSKEAISHTT